MSDPLTSGVCAACRAPVHVTGATKDPYADYRWYCPNAACRHHDGELAEHETGDMEQPWWVLAESDTRTEAEVVAAIKRLEQRQAEARAAYEAKDWERFRELVQADVDEAAAKGR